MEFLPRKPLFKHTTLAQNSLCMRAVWLAHTGKVLHNNDITFNSELGISWQKWLCLQDDTIRDVTHMQITEAQTRLRRGRIQT